MRQTCLLDRSLNPMNMSPLKRLTWIYLLNPRRALAIGHIPAMGGFETCPYKFKNISPYAYLSSKPQCQLAEPQPARRLIVIEMRLVGDIVHGEGQNDKFADLA
jgi:hypothetical protein